MRWEAPVSCQRRSTLLNEQYPSVLCFRPVSSTVLWQCGLGNVWCAHACSLPSSSTVQVGASTNLGVCLHQWTVVSISVMVMFGLLWWPKGYHQHLVKATPCAGVGVILDAPRIPTSFSPLNQPWEGKRLAAAR
eukprot:7485583-Pyramimonas_sp.AAC.1